MKRQMHAPMYPEWSMSTGPVVDDKSGINHLPNYPTLCGASAPARNISDSPTCPECKAAERRLYPEYSR